MAKRRIGIVGLGMALKPHALSLGDLADRVEVAAAFAPFATAVLYDVRHPYFVSVLIVSAVLVLRHKSNIAKLLAGTEGRIGGPPDDSPTGTAG